MQGLRRVTSLLVHRERRLWKGWFGEGPDRYDCYTGQFFDGARAGAPKTLPILHWHARQ